MLYLGGLQGRRAKAIDIAQACDAPVSSVQQVLQALSRARLVDSNSSGNGGYELRVAPERVSLLQIIEAVEGPIDGGRCILSSTPCHWADVCPMHRVWMGAVAAFAAGLSKASLADVIVDEKALLAGTAEVPEDAHRSIALRRATRQAGRDASAQSGDDG